ncbi:MAG TPA: response regulator [Clostridiales bacterium]|nr:response regulator [Clostridiales bacterium]
MVLLLVDDEKITIQGMLDGIRWEACGVSQVVTAFSTEQAQEVLLGNKADLLLCDIEMPGGSGIELLRWIRNRNDDIPCAFLTCHADFLYAKEAVRLGCVDYLLKPLAYSEIEELITKMVRQIHLQRDKQRITQYGEQWIKEKAEEGILLQGKQLNGKEIIDDTISYILRHLSEDITVSSLAGRVHLSPDYLNRLFKKHRGGSINHFIISERMQLAAELLKEDKLSANVIASMVGYESYPNFVSMFKKVYGVTPTQFKENIM